MQALKKTLIIIFAIAIIIRAYFFTTPYIVGTSLFFILYALSALLILIGMVLLPIFIIKGNIYRRKWSERKKYIASFLTIFVFAFAIIYFGLASIAGFIFFSIKG